MSDEKQCSRCSKVKPIDRFSKGYSFCKDCFAVYRKEHRKLNGAKIAAKQHEARNTEKGKRIKREGKGKYYARYPEKSNAHNKVAIAIKCGKLTRQPCEVCGADSPVEAHHDDYSKPLEVRWLCQYHHKEHHLSIKQTVH